MVKNPPPSRRLGRHGFDCQVGKIPWRKKWGTIHLSILAWRIPWTEEPGDYNPWGCKESDTTEHVHRHTTHTRTRTQHIHVHAHMYTHVHAHIHAHTQAEGGADPGQLGAGGVADQEVGSRS